MRNDWEIETLTNAFSALNHEEGLILVKQSIKSKTPNVIVSENKAVIMLDHSANRSKSFDTEEAEPLF